MRSRSCLLLSAWLLLVPIARGQEAPSKQEMEKAHQAYSDGEAAFRLGRFDEAEKRYEEAYRIVKFPTMLFDIAQTNRRWYQQDKNVDHLRKALDMYKAFLRDAPTAKQRPIAERAVPELEKIIAAESARRRAEMLARASGREGLFFADQLMAEGANADAAQVLDRLLGSRGNSRDVLLEGLSKRALVAGQLGQKDVAIDAFKRVLAIDAGFFLPEGSDKISMEAYQVAQQAMHGKRPLTIAHVPPGEVAKKTAAKIPVTVDSDPLGMVAEVGVFYRAAGGGAFSSVRAKGELGVVEVPASFLAGLRGGTRVEYYVAALDEQESEIALLGTAKEPFVFTVAPDQAELTAAALQAGPSYSLSTDKPAYKKWWVWTLVGGVAVVGVAVGVGLYFAYHASDPPAVPFPTP